MCGECQNTMPPRRKRKRTTTRRRRPRRVTYSQVGGVGPGLPIGILKAGYGITKAIGDHQTKRAIAIGEKRRREVASGKRKKYAGESFNCSIMLKKYKKQEACPPSDKRSSCLVVHDENDAESNEGAFSRSLFLYSSPAARLLRLGR